MRLLAPAILFALSLPAQTRITGVVLNAVTNEPIPGASVSAQSAPSDIDSFGFHRRDVDLIHPSRTQTDDSGQFSFEADSALSSLHLSISHPGFRAENNRDPAASVTVRSSDARDIRVRLTPVSIIQGSVSDPAGVPLPGIAVQAIRIDIRDGRQFRTAYAAKTTNDRGEYTFDGLPAGAYFLRATGDAYGPVYYPSASNPDSAQALPVAPGKAITVGFTLESHQTYRIHGIVTNPPPRRPLTMRLLLGDDPLGNSATISPNGTFEMAHVAPGSYLLQAYTPNSTPPDFGETLITVGERDLLGVKIALTAGIDVSGHVEFRGPIGSEHFAAVRALAVNARRWPIDVAEPSVIVNERGNFLLKNLLPGQFEIAVRGLPDFYVAEIHSGGTNVLAEGLAVTSTGAPPLTIVMQAGGGQIEGTIEGAPAGNFEVALIARLGSVQVPTIVRAVAGRFHASGLTPGEYTLYAWQESRAIEYRNPWVLTQLSAYAFPITVRDGARHTVTLNPIP